MNAFVVLATLLASAQAGVIAPAAPGVSIVPAGHGPTTFVRAPAHDSASIESHRLGGNFAYSTAEAHAFASVTPQFSTITHPVAETTHTHQPASIATVQPAPVVRTHHAASPVFGEQPVFAQEPVHGVVGYHTEVHQPIVKTQHLVHHAPTVATVHAAPVAIAAAPIEAVEYAAAPAVGYAHHGFAHHGLGYAHGIAGYGHAYGAGYAAPAYVA